MSRVTGSAAQRREIGLLRLVAQRLVGEPCATAAAAVRWMTATQAQDFPGALTSVALRTADRTLDGVRAAMDDGSVVRSWPMRGTLHLTAAEDLGWMLAVTTDRVMAGVAKRREQLGLDDAAVETAREVAVAALEGGGRLSRAAVLEVWEKAGISTAAQRGYHLIWSIAQTGTFCWGPTEGGAQVLVLLDEWVPSPRRLSREEAVAEWLERYVRSHGPTTLAEFMWWTKITAREARPALEAVRDRLEPVVLDGTGYLMDPSTPERLAAVRSAARGVRLLPGFDEFVLGYGDRDPVVAREFAERVCPGGNGMFQPTVVAGGEVVGTWRRRPRGAVGAVDATPFTAFTSSVAAAVPRVSARLPA